MPVKRKTVGLVLGAAVAVWAISGWPLWIGWQTTPADEVFLARVPITASDTPAYYSQIEQSRQGRLLFANQFTSEAQRPTLFHPLWLVTGWIAAIANLTPPIAYQAARLLATIAFMWLAWVVLGRMFTHPRWRWFGLILLVTSSGLGWLTSQEFRQHIDLGATPVDLWVAESNTFMSISHSALFIGSQALMLFILWQFWRWVEGERMGGQRWLGPALALLALIHPYDVITVVSVMGAWAVWQTLQGRLTTAQWRNLLISGAQWAAWLVPVVLYEGLVVFREQAMLGWLQQNLDYSSAPYLVLLAYGTLVPLAAYGAFDRKNQQSSLTAFLVVWIIVTLLLLYFPGLTVQRRLMNGLHIPIAILAAAGLMAVSRQVRGLWRGVVVGLILVTATFSNVLNITTDSQAVIPGHTVHYPPRITQSEAAAAEWLRDNTQISDVIWAEVWLGNALPGLNGRTVVMGHAHQTLNLQGRLRDWLAFQQGQHSESERSAMLQRLNVDYIVWRDQDRIPGGHQPDHDPRWQLRFIDQSVRIFALER